MATENSSYIVYVDESGDPYLDKINPDVPVFVLCFCVFKKNDYAEKVIPSLSKLKFKYFGHDMVILHERDIRKKEGIFSKLGKEAREAFLEELTAIIENAEATIISVVIHKEAHRDKYCHPYEPYSLAMRFGMERLRGFLSMHDEKGKNLHIICESRGRKEDEALRKAFHEIKEKMGVPFDLIMAPKTVNSNGLQLADLTARPIGLYCMRPDQENRTYEILKKKFWRGLSDCCVNGNGLKEFPITKAPIS